jgi:uncharacterized membrane protein YdcZ (DUF606 family)
LSQLGGDGFAQLRRWTVIVLLGLLVVVIVVGIVDRTYKTDPAFYTLVGGMIAGLFVAEGVALFRRKDE